jgi:hypothetical protein
VRGGFAALLGALPGILQGVGGIVSAAKQPKGGAPGPAPGGAAGPGPGGPGPGAAPGGETAAAAQGAVNGGIPGGGSSSPGVSISTSISITGYGQPIQRTA